VPRISEFFGIVISMYFNDHAPPHFHAAYGEHEAIFKIDTSAILQGYLPRRAQALVLEWANRHQQELNADWHRARNGLPLAPIPPLE
jgi:hypothetical protein